ncbi:MAG: response regulator [bacterium]|nr:response regulator [bacterium]
MPSHRELPPRCSSCRHLRGPLAGIGLLLLTWLVGILPMRAATAQRIVAEHHAKLLENPTVRGVDRLNCMLARARALLSFHIPSAIEALQVMRVEAERQQRPEYVAMAMGINALIEAKRMGADAALEEIAAARAALPDDAPMELRAHFALVDATLNYIVDRYGSAAKRLTEAMRIADADASKQRLADALISLHDLLNATMTGHDPRDDLLAAEALLEEIGDERGQLRVKLRWISYWLQHGEEQQAQAALAETLERARKIGDRIAESDALAVQYDLAMAENAWDRAIAIGSKRIELARALADDIIVTHALDQVAWAHILRDDAEAAEPYVRDALTLANRLAIPGLQSIVLESAQELALLRGDRERLFEVTRQRSTLDLPGEENIDRERRLAREELRKLRDNRSATHDASRLRAEELEQQRLANEERIATVRWLGLAFALLCVSVIALMYRAGKRRAERMHAELRVQAERASRNEEARRQLERHVRQLERLDSLGLLSAGIAHDFNNILTAIVGHTEMLRDEHGETDRESFDAILQAAQRAGTLCSRMLDYSKPTLGDQEVVDLRDIVAGTRTLIEVPGTGSARLDIELADSPVLARVDRSGIEQVLVNLATNARDPAVGATRVTVRVRADAELPSADSDGLWFGRPQGATSYAAIEFHDNGRGISGDQLPRIFDPFYTTRFEGRGLGLSAAYGILTGHGGAFHVRSTNGSGTCFTAFLPGTERDAPIPEPAAAPSPPSNEHHGSRVLVVDDEEWILSFVKLALEGAGHAIDAAESADAALAAIANQRPELALVDLTMPGTDGLALLTKLRQHAPDLRVVIMSGHDEGTVRDRLGDVEVSAVLCKPFTTAELRACVGDALPYSPPNRERLS